MVEKILIFSLNISLLSGIRTITGGGPITGLRSPATKQNSSSSVNSFLTRSSGCLIVYIIRIYPV